MSLKRIFQIEMFISVKVFYSIVTHTLKLNKSSMLQSRKGQKVYWEPYNNLVPHYSSWNCLSTNFYGQI